MYIVEVFNKVCCKQSGQVTCMGTMTKTLNITKQEVYGDTTNKEVVEGPNATRAYLHLWSKMSFD